jgi:dolichyl-phosphate-mannose--protein O-mannosyl transferase
MSPYEITHPPLGKIIIMAGMALFGVTPFGWRVMGALFGVFMVPMIYYLARRLLRSGRMAFAAAFMMCWDFMHFAQTRIATIDVFAVFFILCMYYCMARYLELSHPEADRKKRLVSITRAFFFGALASAAILSKSPSGAFTLR